MGRDSFQKNLERGTEEVEGKDGSTGRIFRSRSASSLTRMDHSLIQLSGQTPESLGRLVGLLLDNTNQDRRRR